MGIHKKAYKRIFVLMVFCMLISLFSTSVCFGAQSPVNKDISVKQVMEEGINLSASYKMTARDGAPLPGGETDSYSFKIKGTKDKTLNFVFESAGIYTYTLEMTSAPENMKVANSKYQFTIYVENANDGSLKYEKMTVENAKGEKCEDIGFNWSKVVKPEPPGGDDDDDDDDKPDKPSDDNNDDDSDNAVDNDNDGDKDDLAGNTVPGASDTDDDSNNGNTTDDGDKDGTIDVDPNVVPGDNPGESGDSGDGGFWRGIFGERHKHFCIIDLVLTLTNCALLGYMAIKWRKHPRRITAEAENLKVRRRTSLLSILPTALCIVLLIAKESITEVAPLTYVCPLLIYYVGSTVVNCGLLYFNAKAHPVNTGE